jgi:hypothetical protein
MDLLTIIKLWFCSEFWFLLPNHWENLWLCLSTTPWKCIGIVTYCSKLRPLYCNGGVCIGHSGSCVCFTDWTSGFNTMVQGRVSTFFWTLKTQVALKRHFMLGNYKYFFNLSADKSRIRSEAATKHRDCDDRPAGQNCRIIMYCDSSKWSTGGMMSGRGKPKSQRNLSIRPFVHHESHTEGPLWCEASVYPEWRNTLHISLICSHCHDKILLTCYKWDFSIRIPRFFSFERN